MKLCSIECGELSAGRLHCFSEKSHIDCRIIGDFLDSRGERLVAIIYLKYL